MPINKFLQEARAIRPQLEVFRRMIIERLKTVGLKSCIFYNQQVDGRSFEGSGAALLSVDVDQLPYFPP